MDAQVNAQEELERIARRRNLTKQKKLKQSSLEKYRAELVSLRLAGASFPDLKTWLTMTHHKTVSHTTIMRYLSKLPEMKVDSMADRDPNTLDMFTGVTDASLQKR